MVTATRQRISAAERRDRILEGALRVFAERGYEGASMTAIAAAAGITPAVIYDHFPSKADLHRTLVEAQANELLQTVATAVNAAPADLRERMRVGVNAYFRFVEQQGFSWWLLVRDPPPDPELARAHRKVQADGTAGIAALMRAAAPPEVLARPNADRDLEMFAQFLRTGQNGLAAWWYDHPETPREDLVDRVIEIALIGFERIASGETASGS